MTTSGTIDSTLTVLEVGNAALELIGQLRPGKNMSDAQGLLAVRHLNMMLKSWQANGVHLWREQDYTLTWPAATPDGTLNPEVIDVEDVRHFRSSTYELQLIRYERDEYNTLPNKTQAGDPVCYSVVKERAAYRLRLWPVPAAETTLKITCARKIEDVTATAETLDVPQEWLEAVTYNLADRLAQVTGMTATPEAQDVKAKARDLYILLRDHQRSGSVFMQPA